MTNAHRSRLFFAILVPAVAAVSAMSASAQLQPQTADGLRTPRRSEQAKPTRPTSKQLENMEARIAAAVAIVNRFEPEAKALGRASGWRRVTLDALLSLPLSALERVEQEAVSADSIAMIAAAATDPQVLGDIDADLVYKPITPCRFIDTRNVGGEFIGIRSYDVANNGSVYGGEIGCAPQALFGVAQDEIGAISMNVTVFEPKNFPGFVAVKPQVSSPIVSLVNWGTAFAQVANQAIVTLFQDPETDAEFVIQTSASTSVHIVVDLFGAFIAPQATPLQTTYVVSAPQPIVSGQTGSVASPECTAGYTLTGGGCAASNAGVHLVSSEPSGVNQWSCTYQNTTGNDHSIQAHAVCARVPGR